jgi:hypothetical protein
VQRNHESGGIVIVFSLPEKCDSGNSAISTFCNRDIYAILAIFVVEHLSKFAAIRSSHCKSDIG